MSSLLYTEKTIETKMFLLPNIKNNPRKLKGTIRMQEHECTNYYGEEIKDPVFKNDIFCVEKIKVPRSFTSKKVPNLSKNPNNIVNLFPIKSKNLFGLSKKKEKLRTENNFCKKKSKIFLNLTKIDFPYSKPMVNNSFTKVLLYARKKDKIGIISSKIVL